MPAQLRMPVAEYCSHYWPERPTEYGYPALEVNPVADPRAPTFGFEPSLVDPPPVQKRRRTFKEACTGIKIGERDPVEVDRHHAEQQQHAAEQGIFCVRRPNVDPLVAAWKRHAHKGHEFRVTPAMLAIRVQTAAGGAASSEVSTTAARASGSLISDKSMERLDALGM